MCGNLHWMGPLYLTWWSPSCDWASLKWLLVYETFEGFNFRSSELVNLRKNSELLTIWTTTFWVLLRLIFARIPELLCILHIQKSSDMNFLSRSRNKFVIGSGIWILEAGACLKFCKSIYLNSTNHHTGRQDMGNQPSIEDKLFELRFASKQLSTYHEMNITCTICPGFQNFWKINSMGICCPAIDDRVEFRT